MRAIAVLMVVAFHAGFPIPGGFIGVDVFFVISGFVITSMLQREYVSSGRIELASFYIRRFKRLAPGLAVVILTTMVFSIFFLSPSGGQQTAAKTALGAILSSANFVIARTNGDYFASPAETNPLLNTWSLSVEGFFYLIFPMIVASGWALQRIRASLNKAPIFLVGGIALISFGLAVGSAYGLSFRGSGTLLGFYSPLTRAWEFAAGALLALMPVRRIPSPQLMAAFGVSGFLLLMASMFVITGGTKFPGPWTLLPVIGTLLILFAGNSASNVATRTLSNAPLAKVGDWSYSIFLWHWPFVVFAALIWPSSSVAILIATSISFFPALLSYRWVEQPLKAIAFPEVSRWFVFFVATVGLPLASAGFLFYGANASWWTTWPSEPKPSDHVAAANCYNKPFDSAGCTWSTANADGYLLVAGDSHAFAIADGIVQAAGDLGLSTIVTSRAGCPFISQNKIWSTDPGCAAWQQEVLDFALQKKPRILFIANRTSMYVNKEWGWGSLAPLEKVSQVKSNQEAAQDWGQALNQFISDLNNSGIAVIVQQPIPDINNRGLRSQGPTLAREIWGIVPPMNLHATLEEVEEARSLVMSAELAADRGNPGLFLFDPVPYLCDPSNCPKVIQGHVMYLDWGHLSKEGALRLVKPLKKVIREASEWRAP